jgi:predicted transcriptional regulator
MNGNMNLWTLKNQELVDLIVSRKGGKTTVKIIDKILIKPYNANQLSNILNLDYNTITYHTNIMEEHNFITRNQFKKTYYFHPTDKLINSIDEYILIKEHIENEEE